MDDIFEPGSKDPRTTLCDDVVHGLSQPQKTLPSQYFYDKTGSELFEQITELEEYYPTRTEISILRDHVEDITSAIGTNALLVEYGAGASTKTRILLDALDQPAGYVPIDVSETFLLQTADGLRQTYPNIPIHPIVSDFMANIGLPEIASGQPVGFFPGSTIGNLEDDQIDRFMRAARRLLGDNGRFLIGIDLRKSPDILIPAYADSAGVTAKFNLNLLTRLNRELGANFNLDEFAHKIVWNDSASRIEMHLESQVPQTVAIRERSFAFEAGETIHTEISRKFDLDALILRLSESGWKLTHTWTDKNEYFACTLLTAT